MTDVFQTSPWSIDNAPQIRGREGAGINYPSTWPEGDYLLVGADGFNLEALSDGHVQIQGLEGATRLDEFLTNHGLTSMAERIPVLTIGSNRSPRQLHDKFAFIKEPTLDDQVVPVFQCPVGGVDVVFAGRPSFQGNFPAVLHSSEVTKDTTADLGIMFLTPRQLEYVDKREKGSYDRKELPDCTVEVGGTQLPVQFYDGAEAIFWDDAGPRALEAIKAEGRTIPAQTQADFIDLVLEHVGKHGGMNLLSNIYFDPTREEDRQILRSYVNNPPYAEEFSSLMFGGQVGGVEKPKVAGTAKVKEVLGRLGLVAATPGISEKAKISLKRQLRLK